MDHEHWKALLPDNFSPDSRVWIYQGNRPFNETELAALHEQLRQFYTAWISHNRPVKGWAGVLLDRFLVFIADDTADRLCGSAVDHSLRFVKSLETQYQVGLLDRTLLGFMVRDRLEALPLSRVAGAIESGLIGENTLYFDNTVTTKAALDERWPVAVKDSWIGKRFLAKELS